MYIVVPSIGCGTITKGVKRPLEDLGLDAGKSPQWQTIATCCNVPEDTNRSYTYWRRSSLLLQEGPCPAKLCRADCIKEDCSHDDLLFVYLCTQRTSERGCIGNMNIAVGHQSSGATYSLPMSLDLTSRNDSRRAIIRRKPGTR
ncbi:hypothetical protein AVEN_79585-1 [Araneus ventricosus]|uniref:Uncharacterized protein n=1 Tax=Araneus ventricosus TaxID=182803 RepID=A0A4Y2LJE7_ARAVE|nr:hypothetical protein AVEN_79585-1 [Araneus ventricosus]